MRALCQAAALLLALGVLAAPLAEAQTSPPPLTGLKAIPLVVDSNRYHLEVRWDPWPGARKYTVKWNEGWGFPNYLAGISGNSVVIKRGATPGRTYTVEVTANGAGGAALARASTRVSLHPRPAGPLTLTPAGGRSDALDASWPAMTGVGSYTLRWKVAGEPDNTYAYARNLPPATTTRRITGLSADTEYRVELDTHFRPAGGQPAYVGNAMNFATTNRLTVQGVAVQTLPTHDSRLRVVWRNVPGADDYRFEHKVGAVESDPFTASTETGRVTGATTLTGLRPSTWYTVRVIALKSGRELGSAEAGGRTRKVFEGVFADPVPGRGDQIEVTWPAFDPSLGRYKYVVSYRRTGSSDPWTQDDIVEALSHRITGLVPNTGYTVRVEAKWVRGTSQLGKDLVVSAGTFEAYPTVTGDPPPVTQEPEPGAAPNLSVFNFPGTGASFDWAAADSVSNRNVTGYTLQWATAPSGTWTNADQSGLEEKRCIPNMTVADYGNERESGGAQFVGCMYEYGEGTSWAYGDTRYFRLIAHTTGADSLPGLVSKVTASGNPSLSQSGGESGEEEPAEGVGSAGLGGLSVASVANEPTKLAVSWNAVQDAAKYSVRWKTGAGDYGDPVETTGTGYTVTSLTPGTSYTVNVAAIDGANTLLAEGAADGDTAPRTGQAKGLSGASDRRQPVSTSSAAFLIYHDPGTASADRYNQAIALLKAAGQSYAVRTVSGTAEVARLAGVSNSIMPRFFRGDPTAPGWGPSQPKVNNGGLRWLRSAAGPPRVSVADARVREGNGATLDFSVTLDKAPAATVTVDYATADGTAAAGQDYTAANGTLTFAAGETSKTVPVTVLDDSHDEGEETLTLALSNASGATVADGTATGTIENTDPLPQAWLARFGRTVGTHVTDAISTRLRAGPEASSLTIGGQPVPLRSAQANAANPSETGSPTAEPRSSALLEGVARVLGLGPGNNTGDAAGRDPRLDQGQTPSLNLRQVLLGSAFRLNLGAGAGSAASPRLTAWGRVAGTRFDGQDSTLTLDGDVLTGTVGLDSTWDRLLLGLAVAHSRGNGAFTQTGPMAGDGTLEQTLTSLHPYLRYAVTDQLDVWGTVGYGWGALTLEQDGQDRMKPDTTLLMGAIGSRGILLTPAESGGYQLATRADAMFTRTTSDAVTGLAEVDGDAHRLRMILEGSRAMAFTEGRQLTPTLELGLRHDWGDAETGFGLEVGGRVQYVDPALGLTVDGAVRGLVAHEDSAYHEWGASGTIRVAPGAGGQGLALTLAPSWGATASGVEGLWTRQTTAGLAPGIGPAQTGRLTAEVGYGFAAFARGLLTPYAGTSLADGQARTYRLGTRWQGAAGLTLSLEGTQQDAMGAQPMNQGFRLQAAWGF